MRFLHADGLAHIRLQTWHYSAMPWEPRTAQPDCLTSYADLGCLMRTLWAASLLRLYDGFARTLACCAVLAALCSPVGRALAQELPIDGSCALFCDACEGASEGQNWQDGAGAAAGGGSLQFCRRGSCSSCSLLKGATYLTAQGAIEALQHLGRMSGSVRATLVSRLVIDTERGCMYEISACSSDRIVRAAQIFDHDAAVALRFGAQTFTRWLEANKRVLVAERRGFVMHALTRAREVELG